MRVTDPQPLSDLHSAALSTEGSDPPAVFLNELEDGPQGQHLSRWQGAGVWEQNHSRSLAAGASWTQARAKLMGATGKRML